MFTYSVRYNMIAFRKNCGRKDRGGRWVGDKGNRKQKLPYFVYLKATHIAFVYVNFVTGTWYANNVQNIDNRAISPTHANANVDPFKKSLAFNWW